MTINDKKGNMPLTYLCKNATYSLSLNLIYASGSSVSNFLIKLHG